MLCCEKRGESETALKARNRDVVRRFMNVGREICCVARPFFFRRRNFFFSFPICQPSSLKHTKLFPKNSQSGPGARPGRARPGKRGGTSVLEGRVEGWKRKRKTVKHRFHQQGLSDIQSPFSERLSLSLRLCSPRAKAKRRAGATDYVEKTRKREKERKELAP